VLRRPRSKSGVRLLQVRRVTTRVAGNAAPRYHLDMGRAKKAAIKKYTVRARVRGGSLDLLDRIPLREGDEVLVSISEPVPAPDIEALGRAAGTWKGLVDANALIANLYADRLVTTRPSPTI
jgi:hypothetical protein